MIRLDGQGHHPWIRPHYPHRKKERAKLKVTKNVLPKWKLAMMKLEMNFIAQEDDRIKLCRLTESDIMETSEATLEEAICLDMACGEVGNYAMLEAAPSRPPPKHGWAHKVIQHAAVLFLAALMALATACKKDPTPEPQPTPNQPTDTVTPVDTTTQIVPTREIVIPWCWSADNGLAPNVDTVRRYAMDPTVAYVFIHLIPGHETTWEPPIYKRARDSLQLCIDVDKNKVRGRGEVKVGRDGAHIHPDTLTKKFGMWEPDSLWFSNCGWKVKRFKKQR